MILACPRPPLKSQGVRWTRFQNRRTGIMLPLGFASGLPLALSGGTLQAWMTVSGVDIFTIGLFSLVGIPYTLKFLWSPFMDRYAPPILGRRRGWMFITQVCLVLCISGLGLCHVASAPVICGALALCVAFSSASQDIVIDAYRTDVLKKKERGIGAGLCVTGYRMAMLVSGALALILADHIGWRPTYLLMAALMATCVLATMAGPEPDIRVKGPASLKKAVVEPLEEFLSRPGSLIFLLLIVLYKLGDASAGTLTTAFLIRGVHFTPTEVGTINKALGLAATIFGALAGGGLMAKLGLFRSLFLFGILQAVSNLSFMVLAWMGKSYAMMVFAVFFENLSGGMGTAAFVALLMALCDHRFSATQYALLSALASLGRVFVGPPSGYIVKWLGWTEFFFITFLIALPGLLLLCRMRDGLKALDSPDTSG